jgi:4-amino-4-deoxy-L-arabinose transferase-like glycosyltransferase
LLPASLAKRGFLLLLAATTLVYFYGLGRAPFFGADEPRYAEVAREMYTRGDLVTPTLGGRTWFEKPALGYWAQMAGFELFGVSERAARLGGALAGWLTVLLVGWMCGRVEQRARDELSGEGAEGDESETIEGRSGAWSARGLQLACAGVMASSGGLFVFTRAVNFDILLTATITLSLACFFISEIETDARKARLLLAGFYAGAGCALLAKGLVGIVITLGVVALYQIVRRRMPRASSSLLWGVPLMLLVAASWYAPVMYANGRAFFDEFIIKHHFARFVSNKYHHPGPPYYYLIVIPAFALPWTPLLVAALKDLWWERRRTRGGATDAATGADVTGGSDATGGCEAVWRLRLFALAWIVVPVVFFSASQSKLPGYVLPALPGAAVLAGCELWRYARGARRTWAVRAAGCVMLSAAATIFYGAHAGIIETRCALLVAAPLVAGGAWVVLARGSRLRIACVIVGATLLASMLSVSCAQEGITRHESVRDLLRLAAIHGYADAPVVNLYGVERSSEYYAAGRLLYGEDGEPRSFDGVDPVAEYARERGATVLVIVPVKHVGQLLTCRVVPVEMIGDNGANALVAVHGEAR